MPASRYKAAYRGYKMERLAQEIFENISKPISLKEYVSGLWKEFEEVPVNPGTEKIESEWNGFPAGTHRKEIWHWFEEEFNISVAEDLRDYREKNKEGILHREV